MVLDQRCKDEIMREVHRRTSGIGGRVKIAAAKATIPGRIQSVNRSDYSMNIEDYVNKYHPRQAHYLSWAPPCALKATVGELIKFYHEVRNQF